MGTNLLYRLEYLGLVGIFRLLELATAGRLPPFAAVCAVIEKDGQVLMIDRTDGMGRCLPGGLMKNRETPHEALQREVVEETGFQVRVGRLIGVYSNPDSDPRFRCVLLAYQANITGGLPQSSTEGRLLWQDIYALPNNLAFDHNLVIDHYLSHG